MACQRHDQSNLREFWLYLAPECSKRYLATKQASFLATTATLLFELDQFNQSRMISFIFK